MKSNGFLNFLFPNSPHRVRVNLVLLLGRIVFSVLLAYHGLIKVATFSDLSNEFPNPFGLGSATSLSLVIFAEVFCSLFVLIGLCTRLAVIPIVFAMLVAYLFVHGGYIIDGGELPFIYGIVFALIGVTGAGKYSIDHKIYKKFKHKA